MSNRILLTALTLAACLPATALAQQPSRADSWEFSVGGGALFMDAALRDFIASGAPESRFANSPNPGRMLPTGVARIGYNFNRYAGFSLSLGGALGAGVTYLNPGASITVTGNLDNNTSPFAIVGTEFTRIDGEHDRTTHSTFGAHAGAGLRQMIGSNVALRVEGRMQVSHYNEVPMAKHTVFAPIGTLGLSFFTRGRAEPIVALAAAPLPPVELVRVDTIRVLRVDTVRMPAVAHLTIAEADQVVLRVQFATARSEILPQSRTVLNTVATAIKSTRGSRWQVEGHTDNIGSSAANQKLSEARAQAVVDYLVGRGVDRGSLTAVGFGFDREVFSNSTPEGRAENRRVQMRRIPPAAQSSR
jgi:outer membrane protein OmpA-like peptidoglycan-associated protein/opacity protein-like surface antigen